MQKIQIQIPDVGYRPDVQGLRAMAVLLVVVFHTGLAVPGGFVGVDVFFVLSGYVITGSILRGLRSGEGFSIVGFFGRRIRRLLPALALMTIVCVPLLAILTTFDGREQGLATARSSSTFWANLQLMLFRPNGYFVASEKLNPFLHTWSLSLEEQIYLFFPFILLGLLATVGRRKCSAQRFAIGVGLILLALVSFYLSLVGSYSIDAWPVNRFISLSENIDYGKQLAFYSPLTRLWEFLVGALVAISPVITRRMIRSAFGFAGVALLIFSGLGFSSSTPFPGLAALAPVTGTTLLLVSRGGLLRGFFSTRLLAWIGDRSYSWYLWHWPAITFSLAVFPGNSVLVVAAVVGSLGLAAVSYRFIEEPIRQGMFWRMSWRRTVAIGLVCVGVPFSLASFGRIEPNPELATHEDVEFGCVVAEFTVLREQDKCFWPAENPVGDAVLIGDSQAGHLSGAFITAAHEHGLNARIVTRTGAFFQNTPDRNELARLLIDEVRPRIVVFGQLTMSWDPNYWAPEMRAYVQRLSDAGIGVVVPHRVRKGGEPLKCASIRFFVLSNNCELSAEESLDSLRNVEQIIQLEKVALKGVSRLVFFDPNPVLCPFEPCMSLQSGKWIWRDGGHISREGARRVTPLISGSIASLLSYPVTSGSREVGFR